MKALFFYDTEIGRIGIAEKDGRICRVYLPEELHKNKSLFQESCICETALIKEAGNQLVRYFAGKRHTFSLPLAPEGTPFRQEIWQALSEIPYGETATYKEVAEKVGKPKAARAVGLACKCNPLPIFIPCHRVIGSNGKLTGYAGGLKMKERLLLLEGIKISGTEGQIPSSTIANGSSFIGTCSAADTRSSVDTLSCVDTRSSAPSLMQVYKILLSAYGRRNWWPAQTAYEMMVGAILTQNTAWTNVEKAIANFGERLSPQFIEVASHEDLVEMIRPSGYYNQKVVYLKALTTWFKKYDYDIAKVLKGDGHALRQELLRVKGVGKETADSILIYALEKPFFVIDAYTKRILFRLGYKLPSEYDKIRLLIEEKIPRELYLYNEFHALIVEHAKRYCQKKPICAGCPLEEMCQKSNIRS